MVEMRADLIAPCGMNCRVCRAYQRQARHCGGCNADDDAKRSSCRNCIIKHCPIIQSNTSGFCHECAKYPCRRLRQLDTRYRTKYRMSMIENLTVLQLRGMDLFLQQEALRWACRVCGGILCVHDEGCPTCHTAQVR